MQQKLSTRLPIVELLLRHYTRSVCEVAIYKSETLNSAKDKMLELLCRGVPPVEYLDSGSTKFDTVTVLSVEVEKARETSQNKSNPNKLMKEISLENQSNQKR